MRHLLLAIALAACGGRAASAPAPAAACPDPHADANQALDELNAELEARERAFAAAPAREDDPAWIQQKLAHMVELDQVVRKSLAWPGERGFTPAAAEYFQAAVFLRMTWLDAGHTRQLAAWLDEHGWFRISVWGREADHHAWLLAQHADLDARFQRRVLDLLTPLLAEGETSPSNYAYLHDRVARAEGRPQRYGTQGTCEGQGVWQEDELEDPAKVDELRASVGLGPMSEYRTEVAELCN